MQHGSLKRNSRKRGPDCVAVSLETNGEGKGRANESSELLCGGSCLR